MVNESNSISIDRLSFSSSLYCYYMLYILFVCWEMRNRRKKEKKKRGEIRELTLAQYMIFVLLWFWVFDSIIYSDNVWWPRKIDEFEGKEESKMIILFFQSLDRFLILFPRLICVYAAFSSFPFLPKFLWFSFSLWTFGLSLFAGSLRYMVVDHWEITMWFM